MSAPAYIHTCEHDNLRHQCSECAAALLIPATSVRMENTRFVWDPYFPLCALSLVVGLGGLGKTHLAVDAAARTTRGQLAGDLRGRPCHVIIATAEDDLA
jgi:hypothetical protein